MKSHTVVLKDCQVATEIIVDGKKKFVLWHDDELHMMVPYLDILLRAFHAVGARTSIEVYDPKEDEI